MGLIWTSDKPLTQTELEQKRLVYWETAPTFGGRMEIWQALQAAFSENDVRLARSILEAAHVILPNGNPCDGCFDELGCAYQVPVYCIVPPTNLIPDTWRQASLSIRVPAPNCDQDPFPITVRLSNHQDKKVTISSTCETVGSLKTRVFDIDASMTDKTHRLRFIYLGRMLQDNMLIECHSKETESFVYSDHLQLTPESIIQCIVTQK
ncbi:uncharacterized protein B0P05DRAFT_527231 [Gilbertella persicaria]|uniref:uncharacterized protein n=1 Tax=Gilbertella persicaria TaxID=101096 RepID=UPI00221FBD66|nr:uncharacterized protein B0P05DRAFT_527231 [Gilbertella persicaria]KAI8091381.1 hypothetical protein B0P05DRAFT_527231 [Gilbertella persicaria]